MKKKTKSEYIIQVHNRLPQRIRGSRSAARQRACHELAAEVTIADVLQDTLETVCEIKDHKGHKKAPEHTMTINVNLITQALLKDAPREELERIVREVVDFMFVRGSTWRPEDEQYTSAADFVDTITAAVGTTTLGEALEKSRNTL